MAACLAGQRDLVYATAMKPFQKRIVAAKGDLPAWAELPRDRIPVVAAQCSAADIADILDALDGLVDEKAAVPDWDGDTLADIGKAQELFARILAALPADLALLVTRDLERRNAETRQWIELALAERGAETG